MIAFHILCKYSFPFIFKKYSLCIYFEWDNFVSFFLVKAHKIIIFRLHTTWIHLCNYPTPRKSKVWELHTVVLHRCEMTIIQSQIVCNKRRLNLVGWTVYGVQAHNVILHNSEKRGHTVFWYGKGYVIYCSMNKPQGRTMCLVCYFLF